VSLLVRGVLFVVVGGLVALGIHLLAGATLTVHTEVEPGSQMEVVLDATIREEAEHPDLDMVRGLAFMCQLEIPSSIVGAEVMTLPDGRYRFVIEPTLDEADRKQFKGCLQDARVDHVLASVDVMRDLPQ
jgi:hypothetical protein